MQRHSRAPAGLVIGPDPLGVNRQGAGARPASAGLQTIPETATCSGQQAAPTLALNRPPGDAPWESDAVRSLASRLSGHGAESGQEKVSAMVLEGPKGTVLQAVGCPEDHVVAGQAVATIQKRCNASAAPRGLDRRPPTPPRSRQGLSAGSTALEKSRQKAVEIQAREKLAFGAIYEHRDSCGKPRLIGSTGKMPERQFELDWRQSEELRALGREGQTKPELVWAGVGRGPVGEAQMTEVRRAVVDARSERLRIEKLSGIKPYSSHT